MRKYPHIFELFDCNRKMLALMVLFPINSLISSGNIQHQTIEIKQFHFFCKTKQPNICIFIRVYYISPTLNFFRQIMSRINTIKCRFILIKLCISKFFKGWGGIKNPFQFQNQLLQFLFLIINFPTNLLLEYLITFFFCFVFNCLSDSFQKKIGIFKSLNNFHYVIWFIIWNY